VFKSLLRKKRIRRYFSKKLSEKLALSLEGIAKENGMVVSKFSPRMLKAKLSESFE